MARFYYNLHPPSSLSAPLRGLPRAFTNQSPVIDPARPGVRPRPSGLPFQRRQRRWRSGIARLLTAALRGCLSRLSFAKLRINNAGGPERRALSRSRHHRGPLDAARVGPEGACLKAANVLAWAVCSPACGVSHVPAGSAGRAKCAAAALLSPLAAAPQERRVGYRETSQSDRKNWVNAYS